MKDLRKRSPYSELLPHVLAYIRIWPGILISRSPYFQADRKSKPEVLLVSDVSARPKKTFQVYCAQHTEKASDGLLWVE